MVHIKIPQMEAHVCHMPRSKWGEKTHAGHMLKSPRWKHMCVTCPSPREEKNTCMAHINISQMEVHACHMPKSKWGEITHAWYILKSPRAKYMCVTYPHPTMKGICLSNIPIMKEAHLLLYSQVTEREKNKYIRYMCKRPAWPHHLERLWTHKTN